MSVAVPDQARSSDGRGFRGQQRFKNRGSSIENRLTPMPARRREEHVANLAHVVEISENTFDVGLERGKPASSSVTADNTHH